MKRKGLLGLIIGVFVLSGCGKTEYVNMPELEQVNIIKEDSLGLKTPELKQQAGKDIEYYKENCINSLNIDFNKFAVSIGVETDKKEEYTIGFSKDDFCVFKYRNYPTTQQIIVLFRSGKAYYLSGSAIKVIPLDKLGLDKDFVDSVFAHDYSGLLDPRIDVDIVEVDVSDTSPNYTYVYTKVADTKEKWLLNSNTDKIEYVRFDYANNIVKAIYPYNSTFMPVAMTFKEENYKDVTETVDILDIIEINRIMTKAQELF